VRFRARALVVWCSEERLIPKNCLFVCGHKRTAVQPILEGIGLPEAVGVGDAYPVD